MPVARLDERAVIRIGGAEAQSFLNNLVTSDVAALSVGAVSASALLTPQGKVLFDFLLSRDGDGFRLDCPATSADDLVRRLTLYKLRAKVEITLQDQPVVHAGWQIDSAGGTWLADTRFPEGLAWRTYGRPELQADATAQDWQSFRIAHGVGESGDDYALGDAFPHDVLLDQNGGVSFRKGCFVGQEVVSRMQHRGTARRRLLMARSDGPLPAPGTPLTAGPATIGALGSVSGNRGLAMVRIDRLAKAVSEAVPIEADGRILELEIPGWAGFEFPLPGDE